MTVEDKIDDKELKDINPQRDDYEDEIIQIIKSDEPAYKKKEELDDYHENDIAAVLEKLDVKERRKLYSIMGLERVSEVFAYLDDPEEFIEELDSELAADILENMEADDSVDILDELEDEKSEELIQLMDKEAKKRYNEYVETVTPTHNLLSQMLRAFLTGGIICTMGQGLRNVFTYFFDMDKVTSSTWVSITLIFISVALTAFGIYPKITKYGGAGSLVPITGFANSVAAPAIEFKKEGQVFGIGCQIFKIAGPVVLYGVLSSWILGLIYWIVKMING